MMTSLVPVISCTETSPGIRAEMAERILSTGGRLENFTYIRVPPLKSIP